MQQPLPLLYFISGLVLVVLCFVMALRLAYRKSAKLRDMVQFVLSPKENAPLDLRVTSIGKSFLWFLIIHLSITFIYHFTDILLHADTSAESSIGEAIRTLPLWVILLLPPILEETAFRLPLRRKRGNLTISAAALMFFISAIIFSTQVYEITWPRLLLCVAAALATWLWGSKWIPKLCFRHWLWFLVLFFALLHVINYDLGSLSTGEWGRIILKEAVKIPSALMFSYVRLKHGFCTSVVLHIVTNLSAYLLGALA